MTTGGQGWRSRSRGGGIPNDERVLDGQFRGQLGAARRSDLAQDGRAREPADGDQPAPVYERSLERPDFDQHWRSADGSDSARPAQQRWWWWDPSLTATADSALGRWLPRTRSDAFAVVARGVATTTTATRTEPLAPAHVAREVFVLLAAAATTAAAPPTAAAAAAPASPATAAARVCRLDAADGHAAAAKPVRPGASAL